MKRKFAVLTVLGALIALAVPASSMGSMYPAGHKFSIAGSAKLGTSLGSCNVTSVTGTIPAAPANETETSFAVSTPTLSGCTAGTSVTLGGEWKLIQTGTNSMVSLGGPAATLTMRFTSLPGCKLTHTTPGMALIGIWSNGATAPALLVSSYHAHMAIALTWANDGGSCALAGKTETLGWSSENVSASITTPSSMTVTDTTSPTSVVIAGAKK